MSRQLAVTLRTPFTAYLELTKPRIATLVSVTAAIGYFLGGDGIGSWRVFLAMLAGVALSSAGAGALNHFLERDIDARMDRTRHRPVPSGQVHPWSALLFGVNLVVAGIIVLVWHVNLLTAFLSLLTTFLYVVVYTPLKQWSWTNTLIGAIPGALPPVGGWAAATGDISFGAWILFAILFLWQQPHFYAIAWMFREDYARGGFAMLPVIEPDGVSTFRQIVLCTILLIPTSLLLTLTGLTGPLYAVGAAALGIVFLRPGLRLARTRSFSDARAVLRASVLYLPVLLLLIVVDHALM